MSGQKSTTIGPFLRRWSMIEYLQNDSLETPAPKDGNQLPGEAPEAVSGD